MNTDTKSETVVPWKRDIYNILHIIIIILSSFLVVSISIDTFNNVPFVTQGSYLQIQLWICLFFLFDFLLEFFASKHKLNFFKTHFVFLIISIPYLNLVDYFGLSFSAEVTYLLRFIPLVRGGYALAIVVGWLTKNKASSLFFTYLLMLLSNIYFISLAFFVLEHKINPAVKTYFDALWWACMNVTTVGADIYAHTGIGRVLTVVLGALGMMLFPVFTVYITSIIQRNTKKDD